MGEETKLRCEPLGRYAIDDLIAFANVMKASDGWLPAARKIDVSGPDKSLIELHHSELRKEKFLGTILTREVSSAFMANDHRNIPSYRKGFDAFYRSMEFVNEKSGNIARHIVKRAESLLQDALGDKFDSNAELQCNINAYASCSNMAFHRDDKDGCPTFLPASTTIILTSDPSVPAKFLFLEGSFFEERPHWKEAELQELVSKNRETVEHDGAGKFFVLSGEAYSRAKHSAALGWRESGSSRKQQLERFSMNFRYVRPSVVAKFIGN